MSLDNTRLDIDLYYRTAGDEYFVANQVPVGSERPLIIGAQRNIESFVSNQLLTAGGGAGGKRGAGVLILMPIASVENPNIPGPFLDPFVIAALVMENPQLNYGSLGTNQTAEQIMRRYLQIHHQHIPDGLNDNSIVPGPGSLSELPKEFRDKGLIGYTISLRTKILLDPVFPAQRPVISPAGGVVPQNVTITSASVGASIYFTTDGSPPYSSNPRAQLYSAPFAVVSACTVRAAAQLSGYAASHVRAQDFTTS